MKEEFKKKTKEKDNLRENKNTMRDKKEIPIFTHQQQNDVSF